MKVDTIQPSFTAGEIGPQLLGRVDIAQYANACETVQNMLPRSYGPIISMPGTRYVATVSDSTLRTRLIKFVFNRTDAYVIEMGDLYMRFFTNRGQVVTQNGTEDLSTYSANLKAHWKLNDNVGGTGTTTVLDAVGAGTHNGTASTITSTLSTTGVVAQAFELAGLYHVSADDHADYTRTVSTQPMTWLAWAYYQNNGANQAILTKPGEYELSVDSTDKLSFKVTSGEANTVLLLHTDGTDGSTTFTDSSSGAKAITANGNAQIDTAFKKFGTGSGLFDGTGDYLTAADSADWDFGTGDFTIDTWVRFSTVSSTQAICDVGKGGVAGGKGVLIRWVSSSNSWIVNINNSTVFDTGDTIAADTWYHLALTRSGSTAYLFRDGILKASVANSTNISGSTEGLFVGIDQPLEVPLNGWLDEFRIVKGQAIWTAAFTPAGDAYVSAATNIYKVDAAITKGWHLFGVVFVGDGTLATDCAIYVDGKIATATFTADAGYVKMSDTANIFRIGATNAAGANIWQRMLDNIALIHQALTSAQIATLYTTSAYQLTTVFKENEVWDVHYTQLNDVIWLTHPSHPPQKLIRTSANSWTIADAPILGGPFLDANTPILTSTNVSATSITITPSATTGTVNLTVSPTNASLFTKSGGTLGHHGSYWMVGGLAQTNVTTGLQEEGYARITNVVNSYTATATVIKNLKGASTIWAEGAWSAVRGYPGKVALQGRRLWFGRSSYEPQKEWGSKVFEFENFALDSADDSDGLNLSLSSNESNEIKWLSGGKSLLAGTFGGAFITSSGSTGQSITPDNATASEEVGFGSEAVIPRRVGNYLYYIQRFGRKLRELFYNWEQDTYKSVDRTILAPTVLGDGVVDMDVQNYPETVLCCVLTSGTLATMTREIDQEVTAWAQQTTSGTYTSIAVIPSQADSYDEAWVIVDRWVQGNRKKYVEYFENIKVPDRQDQCLYLHSALTYDAHEVTSLSNVTISLSASTGSVTLTSSSAYFTGAMVNKRLMIMNAAGTSLGEGTITATSSTTSITLSITTTFNSLSNPSGLWGVSVSSVSGLDHLEAKTVGILADGLTESLTRTVASGKVTLGSDYFVVSVGLSYDKIFLTVKKEIQEPRGTMQGKWQRFSNVAFKVNRSTQDFKYGPDSSNLDNIVLAITPTVTTLYTGILPPQAGGIAMRGGFFRGAQVYVKNSNPLPLEVLSIMGELDTYDR